jgi:2-oxoglutarate dehydrogenase E1 component
MAELLAYASLLHEGFDVRLVGEDAQRGTFSHRHGVLIDTESGAEWNPLTLVHPQSQAEIYNSLLSEEAAMGYEYGYAVRHPQALVLWEAQFGDFANGAQVIIDQFLASGETKWLHSQGLVLLLPHGCEGQGPEHTSARLERFLQLCGQGNMQVCCFTSAKQLFHALRRQLHRPFRKPLVLMTPKSFLRNPRVSVPLTELGQGGFEEILDDPKWQNSKDCAQVERVIFAMGKLSLDLFEARDQNTTDAAYQKAAIVRIEQLYPLNTKKIAEILKRYPKAKTFLWAQEEPENMGGWSFIQNEFAICSESTLVPRLFYVGRSRRATTAVGLEKRHNEEQARLVQGAFFAYEPLRVS